MSAIPAEERYSKKYTRIGDITSELKDKEILLRTRLHTSRVKGGSAFLVLREQGLPNSYVVNGFVSIASF